ncbi:WD40-repeat-containing domain protein, partial [Ilyonectria robusta]|uniref:WD40-repeat-containing domain protein n=1 Tax=Ilyonectria robusta TaxID=1079257 RepID=UPI001E8EF0AB
SVAFSPDSSLVASASHDKTVRLWRIEDGACIQELKGHTDSVNSVAFSPDSSLVASASHDRTVRLWRIEDGACIQEVHDVFRRRLQLHFRDSLLLTDVGAISIQSPDLFIQNATTSFTDCLSGIGISEDRCWITWQEKKLFWLPASFRSGCSKVSGSSVVIGCNSGRVIFMKFRPRVLDSYS